MADFVEIGPFTGGLNTATEPSSIGDNDLVSLKNLELQPDGALTTRPPIYVASDPLPTGDRINMIGFYSVGNEHSLIASDGDSATYAWKDGAWTLITDEFAATDGAQYRDEYYLIHDTEPGGVWDGSSFTQNNDIPTGNRIVLFKDRLWISKGIGAANSSRIYVSDFDSSNPVLWNGDFLTVAGGDGQDIVDIIPYYDMLIVFKTHSTYRFVYDSNPALGSVVLVSGDIGLTHTGCVASYENAIFTMYQNNVYDFTNLQYRKINDKLELRSDVPSTEYVRVCGISIWSNRLFVTYKGMCFVYNLVTRTWSEWESERVGTIGKIIPVPTDENLAVIEPLRTLGGWDNLKVIKLAARINYTYTTAGPYTFNMANALSNGVTPGDILLLLVHRYYQGLDYHKVKSVYINSDPSQELSPLHTTTSAASSFVGLYARELEEGEISDSIDITLVSENFEELFQDQMIAYPVVISGADVNRILVAGVNGESANKRSPALVRDSNPPSNSLSVIFASGHHDDPWLFTLNGPPGAWNEVVTDRRSWSGSPGIVYAIDAGVAYLAQNSTTITPEPWAVSNLGEGFGAYYMHVNFIPKQVPRGIVYGVADTHPAEVEEPFDCFIKTKYYDYANAANFKRLMWWGADAAINTKVTARLDPTQYAVNKTWKELEDLTWDSPDLYTWSRPLVPGITVEDSTTVGYELSGRKFIKFLKSIRFRKLSYELAFSSTGVDETKVFKLVTVIGQKAKVPRRVN